MCGLDGTLGGPHYEVNKKVIIGPTPDQSKGSTKSRLTL